MVEWFSQAVLQILRLPWEVLMQLRIFVSTSVSLPESFQSFVLSWSSLLEVISVCDGDLPAYMERGLKKSDILIHNNPEHIVKWDRKGGKSISYLSRNIDPDVWCGIRVVCEEGLLSALVRATHLYPEYRNYEDPAGLEEGVCSLVQPG